MKIKVCGIANNRNLSEIALLQPDYMGFVFYPGSPRDVTVTIGQLQLSAIPPAVKKVAVVVDRPLQEVRGLVARHWFDAVQLHGDEEPDYCRELMNHCEVIKAFRIADSLPSDIGLYEGNCNYFLFDARGKYHGGNSIKFNHAILEGYGLSTPFFLSGGIGDTDLEYLRGIDIRKMYGVDVNSRFEISPGYKSVQSLRHFIAGLRTKQ